MCKSQQKHTILTILGDGLNPAKAAQAIALVEKSGCTVKSQKALSSVASEFLLETVEPCTQSLQQTLATQLGLDVALQPASQQQTDYKLICFDMDSTLIQNETMDEIAIIAGIGAQISEVTESAMRGEISFKESFDKRLALLEGFPVSRLPEIAKKLTLSPGAKTVVSTLRARGVKVALFSGGFTYFAKGLQAELGALDYIHANRLECTDGKLTGKIIGGLVDEKKKAELIQSIAAELGVDLSQTIAVGDGANDLPMLHLAGMGVGYHAKPIVREQADFVVDQLGLESILYLLGIKQADFT